MKIDIDLTILDRLGELFRSMEKVPKWRLFLAFFILGKEVSKPLIELGRR